MKNIKLKIYLTSEIVLFLCLFIFQIIYINKGYALNNVDGDSFIFIAVFHILATFTSFFYSFYLLFNNINKKRIKEDLFIFYFLFALVADIFFSFTKYIFVGHILFILTYLTFMLIRNAKIYEYLCASLIGIIGIIILATTNKLSLVYAIDCFIAPILLLNLIMCIINYFKNKNKSNLLLLIALIMIFISDLCIGISTLLNNITLINIFCLIIWPTYRIGCSLLNTYNDYKRI